MIRCPSVPIFQLETKWTLPYIYIYIDIDIDIDIGIDIDIDIDIDRKIER